MPADNRSGLEKMIDKLFNLETLDHGAVSHVDEK